MLTYGLTCPCYSGLVLVTSGAYSNWFGVSVSICPHVKTHIAVTAGRIFKILGMMMDYDVGLMPIVSKCWYCLVFQMHRQKCLFLKKVRHVIRIHSRKHTCKDWHCGCRVESLYKGHLWEKQNVSLIQRCPLYIYKLLIMLDPTIIPDLTPDLLDAFS